MNDIGLIIAQLAEFHLNLKSFFPLACSITQLRRQQAEWQLVSSGAGDGQLPQAYLPGPMLRNVHHTTNAVTVVIQLVEARELVPRLHLTLILCMQTRCCMTTPAQKVFRKTVTMKKKCQKSNFARSHFLHTCKVIPYWWFRVDLIIMQISKRRQYIVYVYYLFEYDKLLSY